MNATTPLLVIFKCFRMPVRLFAGVIFFMGVQAAQAQDPADSIHRLQKRQSQQIRIMHSDSLKFELQKKHMNASGEFYKKLRKTAHNNYFSRQLYPLLFKKPPVNGSNAADSGLDTIPFQSDKGKVIRSIRIFKSEVFGSSVFDTTIISQNWLDKTLNSVHFRTHNAVIKSYLRFSEGDRLNPVVLSDNERILRQSAFFEDARFIVSGRPGNDSVDVVLVIRDVFPLGFDLKIRDANSSSFKLYNRNILGFGQQLEQSFEVNTEQRPAIYLSEGAYKIRNIRRSFTDAMVLWQSKPEIRRMGIQISRPFISPETRFGGGLNIYKATTRLIPGIDEPATSLEFSVFDFWGGYSTILNRYKSPAFERSTLAITGRYYNINQMRTPSVIVKSLNPAVTLNRYFASLSLIRSGYYRSNMVYGFGRTEDIPAGHLARLTIGYETSILNSRLYSGIKLLSGKLLGRGGFIYSWFETGGFWSDNRVSDGVAGLGSEYISPLYKSGTYRIRSFGSFSYKTGINRISDEGLLIKDNNSDAFNSFDISGDQRITGRVETVVFSPYYLLGFRFAAYAFLESAMVAASSEFILSGKLYPAFGLGLRIRNENLAFSTFQLGFTWYGNNDNSGRNLVFDFTDIPQINLNKFIVEAPDFAGY
ncbi:MAG: hypothetical protein V1775_14520 [Bacteroidota bacterium]